MSSLNATVSFVESCTGGGIAYAVTQIPGSSQWFERSWVTYSNEAKAELVGVSQDTLKQFGAVSEEVVTEMAQGGAARAHSDYCISVSGVAGPSGGSDTKPVGLVWFGIALPNGEVLTFNRRFSGDRAMVREQAIQLGIEKLIQCLVN